MVELKGARVTPDGIVLERGMRLMSSPFAASGAALQNLQPWVDNPQNLTDAQLETVGHLINAAKSNEGTTGTVENPRTGRPMPRMAQAVKEHFEDRGWTVDEETQREEAQERAKERKREQRSGSAKYAAFKKRLAKVNSSAAGDLIM